MGEEDKLEPTEAKEVEGENLTTKSARKRKKQLYNSIRDLMEFWFSDANLGKDRFLSQLLFTDPWIDLEIFLKFNKLRALTMELSDVVKALRKSEVLEVSEDGRRVCRVTPFKEKENPDACTIYVEQIQPDAEHDWLKSVFSEYGPIDYISLPRFKATQKPKGFAFIEFKNPESANRAIEAFKAKGCCLSPQMDPDKLASITTFEKEGNQPKESYINVVQEENVLPDCESKEIEDKKPEIVELDDETVKEKQLKRKHSKMDQEEELFEQQPDETVKEKKSNKRKRKISNVGSNELVEDDEEFDDSKNSKLSKSTDTEELLNKTKKRKTSLDTGLETEKIEAQNGEDLENMPEGEEEDIEEGEKKKRKRKKKHKRNISALSFGLQIMPKVEWKRLRNKYLNLQKQKMKHLKKHLKEYQWNQRTPKWQLSQYNESDNASNTNDGKVENKKTLQYTAGVIIKVTLDDPVVDVKGIKNAARIHTEVRYVDASEGDQEIYLRVGGPELAQQVLATKHWSNMELLKGKEEKQYWDKILKDREEKFSKKIRVNKRGRDKLLKKAEKIQGKHIGFDER